MRPRGYRVNPGRRKSGGIPTWVFLAGAGAGLFFLMKKAKPAGTMTGTFTAPPPAPKPATINVAGVNVPTSAITGAANTGIDALVNAIK